MISQAEKLDLEVDEHIRRFLVENPEYTIINDIKQKYNNFRSL